MTTPVCRDCQEPVSWVRPRWRKGGAMPLDTKSVTRTEPKPLLYSATGDILKRATDGQPLTGHLCHFDTCVARLAAKERA